MPLVAVTPTKVASDGVVVVIAARQHGVVTRRQLLAAGVGAGAIKERQRSGMLVSIHRGVYAIGGSRLPVMAQLMAAVLVIDGEAALSHRSAAYLHGLLSPPGGAIDVSTTRRSRSRPGVRVHHVRSMEAPVAIEGIPCATLPRTLLDLAATCRPRVVERALDQAEVLQVFDGRAIDEALRARRPGSRALRAILDRHTPGTTVTRSELEERFLAICREVELPPAELNAPVARGDDGRTVIVDALWRPERLIVELDGRSFHVSDKAFEDDRARDVDLHVEGWTVLRFTWRQLTRERAWVIRQLRRALSATRPTPAPSRTPRPCPRAAPRSPGS
jgi:predicted transcriptional regulator of viral defense system